jgi:hypothetical protein
MRNGSETKLQLKLGGFQNTFSQVMQVRLISHVKEPDGCLVPLSRVEFLKLAFDWPEGTRISHRFNHGN